jgi:hypothetical protein
LKKKQVGKLTNAQLAILVGHCSLVIVVNAKIIMRANTNLNPASVEQVLRHALGHDVEEKARVAHQLQR